MVLAIALTFNAGIAIMLKFILLIILLGGNKFSIIGAAAIFKLRIELQKII